MITASSFCGLGRFSVRILLVLFIEPRPQSIITVVVSVQSRRQFPLLLLHKLLK